ncbi:MAG: hypothetical protein HQK54_16300 [Oligoflexales bacterium]|nr:hypothetical protein [Oligoflexales bacterium]
MRKSFALFGLTEKGLKTAAGNLFPKLKKIRLKSLAIDPIYYFRFALIFILLTARPTYSSIFIGAMISLLGESLKIISFSFNFNSGTRSGWPQRFVRNPSGFGFFLLLLGLCISGRSFWAFVLLLAVGTILLKTEMKKRENAASRLAFHEYLKYKSQIPYFIPVLIPFNEVNSFLWKGKSDQISRYKRKTAELEHVFLTLVVYICLYAMK